MEIHKICGVCGDKALGYNFNALTCESCKAFFRRNALRNKTFRCITAGNCVLNPKTRKYCRKCRLDKCFQIGMKKDWILTEEEKIMKRRKHRNRDAEKKDADSSSVDCQSQDIPPVLVDKNKNNIFILPILPLSMKDEKNSDEMIQTLNKNNIISFINNKLNLTLDSGTSVVNMNHNEDGKIADGDLLQTVNNNIATNENSIIVYPDNSSNNNNNDANMKNMMDCTENLFKDCNFSSDNSSCSFTSFISSNNNVTDNFNFDFSNIETQPFKRNHQTGNVNEINSSQHEQNSSTGENSNTNSDSSSKTGENEWKISDKVYKHAIHLEYTANPLKTPFGEEGKNLQKLNKLEEKRLEEINQYFCPLYVIGNQDNKKFITDIEEGFKYFESNIKKLIIAVKNIQSFKNMCQEDQIALLKGSASEIKCLLNIRYFNATEDICMIPNPNEQNSILIIDQEYLTKTYGEELYSRCKNFLMSFRNDWKNDESIINLLATILLFYPNRPNLHHREYIMLEYLTYCHLLQRYLQVKYRSVCEAKTIYLNLMSRIEEMHKLNEQSMELLLKLDPKYIGPLTIELYDLQNRNKMKQA